MKNPSKSRPSVRFVLSVACLLAAASAQAALVGHFRLEEGAIDPTTNVTYCAVSTNTGALDPAAGTLTWVTSDLGPLPAPGTLVALEFIPPTTDTAPPTVTTTLVTQDSTGNNLAGKGARTITAWIKASNVQSVVNPTIVHMGPATPSGARVTFRLIQSGTSYPLRCEVQGGGKTGTKNLADNQWHFVAVTMSENATVNNLVLYVDGVQEAISVSSGLTTAINVYTNRAVVIGSTAGSGLAAPSNRGFTGTIDDVRIFNAALTPAEIVELYLGPGVAPSVTQVTDKSFVLGSTNSVVTLNAGALGTPPLKIQWKFNSVNIANATNDALTFSPVNVTNAGLYTVAVTNAYGSTSQSCNLSLNTAPINPPRQAVLVGNPASFSVSMPADSSGYTYQWRTNGVNIAGATSSTLTVNSPSAANAGTNYQVVATLGGNSATSSPTATLNVLPLPASFYSRFVLGDAPAGYWRLGEANGDITAASQTGFYPGAYVGNSGYELKQQGALINDTDTAFQLTTYNYMQVPFDAQLSVPSGLTLEMWVNPASIGSLQTLVRSYGNLPKVGYHLFISATGNPTFRIYNSPTTTAEASTTLTGSATLSAGTWSHVVATYDGTNQALYVNGMPVGTQTATYYQATGIPITFGTDFSGSNPSAQFSGYLDEVAIYSKALSEEQIQTHYFAGVYGSGVAPSITSQPQSQTVILGSTNSIVSFSVRASGSPPMRYQWRQNGTPIPNATNSILTLSPFVPGNEGIYSVTVSNDANSLVSSTATLGYGTGPVSPGAQTVLVGSPATFALTGMPEYQTYSYQWKHAGTNLPGATAPSITIPSAGVTHAGSYTVVATLGAASAESAPALLNVVSAPSTSYTNIILGGATAPIAYWRLGETNLSDPAVDLVAARNGVLQAGALPGAEGVVLGDTDTALGCSGAADSYAEVAYDAALNPSTFTIEFWALVRGGEGTFRSPFTCREWLTGTYNGFNFYASDADRWEFWLGQGTTTLSLNGPAVERNVWVHLAATYDGTTAAFYVNGALVASGATAYVPNPYNPIRIGAGGNSAGLAYGFRGLVDEVALYDVALPAATIATHYAGVFQPGSLPRFTQQPRGRYVLSGETYTASIKAHSTVPNGVFWQRNGAALASATGSTLVVPNFGLAGNYTAVITNVSGSSTSQVAVASVVPGQATSISFLGSSARTIALNGGYAGLVLADNWNEIGPGLNTGSAANLLDAAGMNRGMSVSWSAAANGATGVIFTDPLGDYAMLNGWIEGNSSVPVTITFTGIPATYQSGGYSAYIYLGTEGTSATTHFGYVTVGGLTNYYHGMNLSQWNGEYVAATGTDEVTMPEANYAVFNNLTSPTLTIVAGKPSTVNGPARVSGVQLVANAPGSVPLVIEIQNGVPVLSWSGSWVLQKKAMLDGNPGNWVDVTSSSPHIVPLPLETQQFYRLRNP